MKSKNNIGFKIAIGIVFFIILLMVCLSPKLIGRLLGNINSIDTTSSETVNTGVILNLNKIYNYSNNDPIVMEIYNGSNNTITINSIIYRRYCPNNVNCEDFTITNLDNPITIEPDKEKKYMVNADNVARSGYIDVGVQYSMLTIEDGIEITKTYNIVSSSQSIEGMDFNNLGLNSQDYNKTSEEFVFRLTSNNSFNFNVKLSDNNIYMDKSENLSDLDVLYYIKSGITNKWFFDHPQTNDAISKDMFGSPTISNIQNYFTFNNSNLNIRSMDYTNVNNLSSDYQNHFELTGTPINTVTNQKVYLGFYFEQYKDNWPGQYQNWSDQPTDSSIGKFESDKIPQFNLTIYDKSNLRNAIENGYKKLNKKDYEVDPDSWNDYWLKLENAILLYKGRDKYTSYSNISDFTKFQNGVSKEVTQNEINNMVNALNNTNISSNPSANYAALNNLVNKIQDSLEQWYPKEAYQEFKIVYDERTNYENLSSVYQVKLDNYVTRLQNAYNNLNNTMYDANYVEYNKVINNEDLRNAIDNPAWYTSDADNYTTFINLYNERSNYENLKISRQQDINNYVTSLQNAFDVLVMNSADYTDYNTLLDSKKIKDAAGNPDWYTNDATDYTTFINLYNEKSNYENLKISRQQDVDDYVTSLQKALDALEMNSADYTAYNALLGSKKIKDAVSKPEWYTNDATDYNTFKELYKQKSDYENLKISRQEDINNYVTGLQNAFAALEMNSADYTKLNDAVSNAKKYESNKFNYTNYSDLEKLINSINYNLTCDQQEKVDNLTKKINAAISNLVKKPADYRKLSEVLSKIPNDYSNYEVSLQIQIKDFLEKVKLLPNNLAYDEQEKIDELAKLGNDLVAKLSLVSKDNISNNNNGNTNKNESIPNDEESSVSTDVILSYLKVNGKKVDISKTPFEYTVGYDVAEADISVGLSSSSSTSKIYGGKVLVPGNNNITIIVTTKEGKTYTYSLIITRSQSSDYLSDLSIKESSIDFNKTKQEYNVKVGKNVNKLDLSAIAEDKNAKVTIKGNKNIKNGSKVKIEVESADGNIRVYTLNIQKSSVDVSIILILIMVLATIVGIFRYIQEKRKLKSNT